MPDGLGHFQRSDTPPISDDDENITMNPKTPSDYALHAVFIRFAASAETVIDKFLRHGLVSDPSVFSLQTCFYIIPGVRATATAIHRRRSGLQV